MADNEVKEDVVVDGELEDDQSDIPLNISDGTKLLITPKFNSNCRVCLWSKDNIELYNWICTLALQGYSPGRISVLLEEHLKSNYPSIPNPTRKSVWNHFIRHVQPKESIEILAARKIHSAGVFNPLITQRAIDQIKTGDFDEYKELCALYVKFREVHDKIYELTESLTTTTRCDWSQSKIQTYVSMVNTQKSILAEIGKMRQSDKLVIMVAKYIVEMFARNMVSKLNDEFTSLGCILKRQGADDTVLEAFNSVTHNRLAKLIVEEAENAFEATRKEFKLPSGSSNSNTNTNNAIH